MGENIWSFEQLQAYLSEKGLDDGGDFVAGAMAKRIKQICTTVFQAASGKLQRKRGCKRAALALFCVAKTKQLTLKSKNNPVRKTDFDLLGLDLMLDESLNLSLLEVNTNPALHIDCDLVTQHKNCCLLSCPPSRKLE